VSGPCSRPVCRWSPGPRSALAWTALGWAVNQTVARVEGHIDGRRPSQRVSFVPFDDGERFTYYLSDDGDDLLAISMLDVRTGLDRVLRRPGPSLTSVAAVNGIHTRTLARSRLDASCLARPTRGYYCVAYDGQRSHVWSFDAASRRLDSKGALRGSLYGLESRVDGAIAALREDRPVVLRPEASEIVSIAGVSQAMTESREVSYVAGHLAVLDKPSDPSSSVLRLYAVDLTAASARSARAAR
jgi:hypothetical protein